MSIKSLWLPGVRYLTGLSGILAHCPV